MVAQLGASNSRFLLESHNKDGSFVASLPYRDLQAEFMLGVQGAQLRVNVPYRGYKQVTQANLYAGIHELWFYDSQYSTTDPIFAGPLWDATPSSNGGVIACSAQDGLTYLAKRLLKANEFFNNMKPTAIINSLFNYTNGVKALNMVVNIVQAGSDTVSVQYKSFDRNKIMDLIDAVAQLGDGVDYYMRNIGGVHNLYLYGGKINPAQGTNSLEYGGALDGYSVDYNAQAIVNDYDLISSNNRIGNAVDAAAQAAYGALYQAADSGSDLTSSASLNQAAATYIQGNSVTAIINSIVVHKYIPMVDFDFGSQFQVVIDDSYVQINMPIRVVGWQLTVGQGDKISVNIYVNDTTEV